MGDVTNWVDSGRIEQYRIKKEVIKPYTFAATDTGYLRLVSQVGQDTSDGATWTWSFTRLQGVPGLRYTRHRASGTFTTKVAYWLCGDTLYKQAAFVRPEDEDNAGTEAFFDSLRFMRPEPPLFETGPGKIYRDLESPDSAVEVPARKALNDATFGKADIPGLLAILLRPYPQDTFESRPVQWDIEDKLKNVDDSVLLTEVDSCYRHLEPKADSMRYDLLEVISHIGGKTALDSLFGLLNWKLPTQGTPKYLAAAIRDNTVLTANYVLRLMPLLKDSLLGPYVFQVVNTLLDSGLVTTRDLATYYPMILSTARRELCETRASWSESSTTLEDAWMLLQRFADTAAVTILRRSTQLSSNRSKMYATCGLLALGKTVSGSLLHVIAADRYWRTDLYDSLRKHHKAVLFPKDYLNRRAFAESYLYNSIVADDDGFDSQVPGSADAGYLSMRFLRKALYPFNGKTCEWYLFAFRYKTDSILHLGMCGPYEPGGVGVVLQDEVEETLWNTDDAWDEAGTDAQAKQMLKRQEQREKESDDSDGSGDDD